MLTLHSFSSVVGELESYSSQPAAPTKPQGPRGKGFQETDVERGRKNSIVGHLLCICTILISLSTLSDSVLSITQ